MANLPTVNRSPQNLTPSQISNFMYPTDLVTSTNSGKSMYMNINLCTYNSGSISSPGSGTYYGGQLQPYCSMALPIPMKINDQQTVDWQQASITDIGASVVTKALSGLGKTGASIAGKISNYGSAAASLSSFYSGTSINPFLVMLFKTQNFKRHLLQWLFSPNNQQDTDTLNSIINYFKSAELPGYATGTAGFILNYPSILECGFSVPNGQTPYLYNFKPAALTSLAIDWAAGATPAFFQNGAPALVSITMELTEIELWFNNGPGSYA